MSESNRTLIFFVEKKSVECTDCKKVTMKGKQNIKIQLRWFVKGIKTDKRKKNTARKVKQKGKIHWYLVKGIHLRRLVKEKKSTMKVKQKGKKKVVSNYEGS